LLVLRRALGSSCAALCRAFHVFMSPAIKQDVDGRDKPGDDGSKNGRRGADISARSKETGASLGEAPVG